ncbi:hypothetical protein PS684_03810 [Pseudomonas fluorescens]|nr:hypothetical protein PS681_05460 [Pseudomonas fluorescens]VVN60242.1 hypothetical protein PS684_03810 [Pseudomonas fluorescens]
MVGDKIFIAPSLAALPGLLLPRKTRDEAAILKQLKQLKQEGIELYLYALNPD